MSAELLKRYGIVSYEETLGKEDFQKVSAVELRNESLAYLLGKWLRSLHAAAPDSADPAVRNLPKAQEMWPAEETVRLTGQFLRSLPFSEDISVCGTRAERLRDLAENFAEAFRNIPEVFSFPRFDEEHILINRDRTQAVVRCKLMIGYRYRDIRRICSRLQFWGQWAFLWGYAMPVPETEKYLDRLSEILTEIQTESQKEEPDYGRTFRLLEDPLTEKALTYLEEKQR